MNVALWIAAVVLALGLGVSGLFKIVIGREKLTSKYSALAWAQDLTDSKFRTICSLEFLGGLGLILPALTGIAPVLVPLAAVGLALIMIGAMVFHVRRGDGAASFVAPLVFTLLAIFVAWGRFGAYAF